jgi:RNA polymerase sigma factor (sigma-70 family)
MGHAITDDELVAASRRGERDAFGHLVERHLDAVWAVSFSSTRDHTLSDDVAQDTFVAAWAQLDRLREVSRLRAWLCGIARNLAKQARRRAGRERPEADAGNDRVGHAATPFEALSQAESDQLVGHALAQLPVSYREVLVLYYQHERSIKDVATTLAISEEAAMQRLTRGRRLLATHVVGVVEGALTARRPRRAIVAGVLAMLPPLSPSSIGLSRHPPQPIAGVTMLKIAAILIASAGVAGAAFIATRPSLSPTASTSATAPSLTARLTSPVPTHAPVAMGARVAPTSVSALPAPESAALAVENSGGNGSGSCAQQVAIDGDGVAIDPALIASTGLYTGPSRGPADAPVQIAVYQDLECQFCAMVMGTIDQLWDEYPGQLRLVVKDFPLPGHPHAQLAAEAARAADHQGTLWQYRDLALAFQEDLDRDSLVGLARRAGLDVPTFIHDLDGHVYADAIAADVRTGRELAVEGTPAFFINGRRFTGAQPIEQFRAEIDRALAAQQR